MSKLDQIVFVIENGRITETTIRDLPFDRFVEQTTTPQGIAPRMHVRGNELWTWGYCGDFPKLISEHETAEEALEALEDSFAWDFWDNSEIDAYADREIAEQYLQMYRDDGVI